MQVGILWARVRDTWGFGHLPSECKDLLCAFSVLFRAQVSEFDVFIRTLLLVKFKACDACAFSHAETYLWGT